MDLTAFSSVGTQTPTEDYTFEFPECFNPSPRMSRSSISSSSIGTQTSVRQCSSIEFEPPETCSALRTSRRPKLFRRHSTGSNVYNFSSSPTFLTAFGRAPFVPRPRGIFSQTMFAENKFCTSGDSGHETKGCFEEDPFDDVERLERVGQQLRRIGDDLDRGGQFRSRSLSVSRFFVNVRRRTSSSSS